MDDDRLKGPHCFHAPKWNKGISICCKCGLVFLRNAHTEAAIKFGCGYKDDSNFIAAYVRIFKKPPFGYSSRM